VFFTASFVYVEIIQVQNRRQSNIQKTLQQELHNLSQISCFSWVSETGYQQSGPGAPVLGLAKSTY